MFPKVGPHVGATTLPTTVSAATKLKDAAKSASELAKSKASPIYVSCQPSQT